MKKIVLGMMLALPVIMAVGAVRAAEGKGDKPSWTDKVTLKGDFRYRHEWIDEEGKKTRTRHRIRARVGAEAEANDELKVYFKLSTSEGGDPVSGNQTLGGSESRKDIFIDQAYFDWTPEVAEGVSLKGGKMPMPFIAVSDLIWDGDLNPEGLAVNYTLKGEAIQFMLNGGGFWLEERKADDDTMLYGGQAALKFKAEGFHVLGGGSYYAYQNMKDFTVLADAAKSFGNSSTVTATNDAGEVVSRAYACDFANVEGFGEVGFDLTIPVKVYGNYVVNTEADDEDTGFLAGVTLGKAKAPGSFEVGYNYRDLEKDCVVGAFTDSDSFGGGTDGEGHKVQAKYQVTKNWQAAVTYFKNEKGVSSGKGKDYDRLQVDLAAKF